MYSLKQYIYISFHTLFNILSKFNVDELMIYFILVSHEDY
jgi:hypothetical protein